MGVLVLKMRFGLGSAVCRILWFKQSAGQQQRQQCNYSGAGCCVFDKGRWLGAGSRIS